MTIAAITKRGTIHADDSVRGDFAECSSGNGYDRYYETKGSAIHAFESVLTEYGLCFDPDDLIDMPYNWGRIIVDIYTNELECSKCVGRAMLTWHKMPSGRWEFVGYIT